MNLRLTGPILAAVAMAGLASTVLLSAGGQQAPARTPAAAKRGIGSAPGRPKPG